MTLEREAAVPRRPVTAARHGRPGRRPPGRPDDAFRARLREFFTAHHPGRPPKDPRERLAWTKAWLATLFDAGYAGPSWPREFGGMELSFAHQVIYHEEAARARVPGPLGTGLNIAAPTIIKYATQEQKRRWLAPMLRGDTGMGAGLLGTGGRLGPAEPAHHRPPRRRGVRRQRAEGLDVARGRRRRLLRPGPHGHQGEQAEGHHLPRHRRPRARRAGAAAARPDRGAPVRRGVLR